MSLGGRACGNRSSSNGSGRNATHSGSSSSSGGRTVSFGQPLFDLAMPKDEVKARLAPIPVYTVANPKNEFVLVAGEVRMASAAGVQNGCLLSLGAWTFG